MLAHHGSCDLHFSTPADRCGAYMPVRFSSCCCARYLQQGHDVGSEAGDETSVLQRCSDSLCWSAQSISPCSRDAVQRVVAQRFASARRAVPDQGLSTAILCEAAAGRVGLVDKVPLRVHPKAEACRLQDLKLLHLVLRARCALSLAKERRSLLFARHMLTRR